MTDREKKRVLVVEDDADLRRGLQIRLAANGYDVVIASDGASAVSAVRREHPDVIILDLGLPAGDGFVIMERLSVMMPSAGIPIIVLTAKDPHEVEQRALTSGARAFLRKPVENHVLLAAIKAVVGG